MRRVKTTDPTLTA